MRQLFSAAVIAAALLVMGGPVSADPGLPNGPWVDPSTVTIKCALGSHVLMHPHQPWAQSRCVAD